jgi:hypothetical protein
MRKYLYFMFLITLITSVSALQFGYGNTSPFGFDKITLSGGDTTIINQNNVSTIPIQNVTGIPSCTATQVLTNRSGTVTCVEDQQGSGGSSTTPAFQDFVASLEFTVASSTSFDPFLGTAISSGTIAAGTSDTTHIGVMGLRDSTTVYGGYMIRTDATTLLLSGNENATFIFRQNTIRPNATFQLGFFDNGNNASTTDGCFFLVRNTSIANLTASCANNRIWTNSTDGIIITNAAWYMGTINVNTGVTEVNFTLYNNLNNPIWSSLITTNIPKLAGRETGFGAIVWESTADAAADIVQLDYMALKVYNRTQLLRNAYLSNASIKLSQEFLASGTASVDPFIGAAVSSGTSFGAVGTTNHIGIVNFTDSTTAGGGYRVQTDATTFLIGGDEYATFVFNWTDNRYNTTARLGFLDTTTATIPTDGCWININASRLAETQNNTLRGMCRANGALVITNTYNLTRNTYYNAIINVNALGSVVNFTLKNEAGAILWTDKVESQIPTATGRETGFGAIATEGSTDAAANIMFIDYMDLVINRSIVR